MRRDRIITTTCIIALFAGCTAQQGPKTVGPVVQESVDAMGDRSQAANGPAYPPPPPPPVSIGQSATMPSPQNRGGALKSMDMRGRMAERELLCPVGEVSLT